MRRLLVLVVIVAAGCSSTEPPAAEPATAPTEASYGLFAEAWNIAVETGSEDHMRRVLHPETLRVYGIEECADYMSRQRTIPDEFDLSWAAVPAAGPTEISLDGVVVTVDLDTPTFLQWPGGALNEQWAVLPDPSAETTPRYVPDRRIVVDCGTPL